MEPKDLNYRYKALDTLRVFAMLVGIPFHVSLAYGVFDLSWIKSEFIGHISMDYFSYWIRIFRMPLFFLISGFFAHLTLLKRKDSFLKERLKRILIPFLIFGALLLPIMRAIYLSAKRFDLLNMQNLNNLTYYLFENFFSFADKQSFSSGINYAHLWFLMYLSVFSVATYIFRNYIFNLKFTKISFLLLPLVTSLSLLVMNGNWIDDPFIWYPKPSLLFYYGVFFFAGLQLLTFRSLLNKYFNGYSSIKIVFIVLSIIIAAFRIEFQINNPTIQNSFVLSLWMSTSTWMLITSSFFISYWLQHKCTGFISYFSKSSYFIYIIHMPLVLLFQLVLNPINLNWIFKFIICTLLTFLFSIIIYEAFVKKRFMERLLKGQY